MLYLRQSTASQSVVIGPFVDDTDGASAETGLTIDAADIRLSKNGANIVGKNSGGGTHDELGYYTITLDATDTNTVGRLQLMVHESGALPVYHEYMVLEEAVYDAMYAASAPGPLLADSDGSGLTEAGGTGDHLTAVPWNASWDAEVQSEVTDALNAYDPPTNAEMEARTLAAASYATASALATVDGNVDAILVDTGTTLEGHLTDIKGATFNGATDSLEAIRDQGDSAWITATGFSTHSAADVWSVTTRVLTANTNLNDPTAAQIRAEIDSNSTQLAAIVADTNELQADWANGGRLDLILDARASQISVDNLNDISAADVWSVTLTELSADPGVSPAASGAVLLPYMAIRNQRDTTATTDEIMNSAGTTILTASVSDDGATFSKGKYA